MTRVTASLPFELAALLERSARENERSLAAEVRIALREHLKASPLTGGRGAQGEPVGVATMAAGSTARGRS